MDRREELQDIQNGEFADLERELRQTLRRVEPPLGFADRVIARIEKPGEQKRAKVLMMPVRWRPWISGALAACLAVGVFATQEFRARERREQAQKAEMAKQQFEMAVQITGDTLNDVRQQIRQAGIPVGE